jgi:ribosome-associated translation inhibitor RaiA
MRAYHVDGAVMRLARPDAAFMHCLPAHRGEEVEASVIDGRHAVVWEQVANRLPTEQAVIYALATADRGRSGARGGRMIDVELHVPSAVPARTGRGARRRIASLDRYASAPLIGARLTLRRDGKRSKKPPFVADVDVRFDGRLLVAHGDGRTAMEAATVASEALRRQLRRVVGADVALRNEPRVLENGGGEQPARRRSSPRKSVPSWPGVPTRRSPSRR